MYNVLKINILFTYIFIILYYIIYYSITHNCSTVEKHDMLERVAISAALLLN